MWLRQPIVHCRVNVVALNDAKPLGSWPSMCYFNNRGLKYCISFIHPETRGGEQRTDKAERTEEKRGEETEVERERLRERERN